MSATLFDSAILGGSEQALDFIGNILESSTEYSIIGKDLEGTILLWNEGARRLYGYEPGEVIGKANSLILHVPEDVNAGRPKQMLETALREGHWEGNIARCRKDGERFMARVVVTPRLDAAGSAIGFLLMSKDVSNEMAFTEELRKAKLFDSAIVGNAQEAVDFITNILESSTEYSVIGKDLTGKILLWMLPYAMANGKGHWRASEKMAGASPPGLLSHPVAIPAASPSDTSSSQRTSPLKFA
jgi:PAS domain S-box-containing protein